MSITSPSTRSAAPVGDVAAEKLRYVSTVTGEEVSTCARVDDGMLFMGGPGFDPASDRVMMWGSVDMIRNLPKRFEDLEFEEGSNAKPGAYVIERAFVG